MTQIPFNLAKHLPGLPRDRLRPSTVISESVVNKGMITTIDPSDIPEGALSLAKNARVRFDKTLKRTALQRKTSSQLTDPNTGIARKLHTFRKYDGTYYIIMFRSNGIYAVSLNDWVAVTGSVTNISEFQAANYKDQVVFTMDGRLQITNTAVTSFSDLATGNYLPKYKYITVFANRVVGANLIEARDSGGVQVAAANPINVGWSGDLAPSQWDAAVNESAGNGPLVESPGDFSDFLTGVFGFTNVLIVLREKSVWEATKLPIASNPFNFYVKIPGIGCDCPNSATVVAGGLAWMDTLTRGVYVYEIGGQFGEIAEGISDVLFTDDFTANDVRGTYDPINKEYILLIDQKQFVYNFITKAWTYDDFSNRATAPIKDVVYTPATFNYTSYDSLVGTYDALTGSYDDLSSDPVVSKGITYLDQNSQLYSFVETDAEDYVPTQDIQEIYETELVSKAYALPDDDHIVNSLSFEVEAYTKGAIELFYSKNDRDWTFLKTFTFDNSTTALLRARCSVRARRFRWRLVSNYGSWALKKASITLYPASMSKE